MHARGFECASECLVARSKCPFVRGVCFRRGWLDVREGFRPRAFTRDFVTGWGFCALVVERERSLFRGGGVLFSLPSLATKASRCHSSSSYSSSSGGERLMTFLCSLLATHTYQNVFFLSFLPTKQHTEKHRIRPSRAGQLESGQTVRQARRRRRLGGPKQSFSRRAGHQAMHHQLETLSNHAD